MGQGNNKCTCFNTKEDIVTAKFEKPAISDKNDTNSNNTNRKSNQQDQPVLKNLKSYVTFKNMENSSSIEEENDSCDNPNFLCDIRKDKKQTNILVYHPKNESIEPTNKTNSILKRREPSIQKMGSVKATKLNKLSSGPIGSNFFSEKSQTSLQGVNIIKKEHKNFENIKNSLYVQKIQKVYKGYNYRKYILPDLLDELKNKVDKMVKELYDNYLTEPLKKQESSIGIKHNENSYKSLYSSEN